MKHVKVGLLGCGTVGSGVLNILAENGKWIAQREQIELEISRVLIRNRKKERPKGYAEEIFTSRPEDIIDDPSIDVVVEVLGGENPAVEYIVRALKAGKPVVTANKLALAIHWDEIMAAANAGGGRIFFDPSVCGGIPVVSIMSDCMQANRIDRILGIINGTTNYILTRMSRDALPFKEALRQAQEQGFAEANAAEDIEGYDAACKLSIMASLARGKHVPVEAIYREGISAIDALDIEFGRDLGYTLKMLAISELGSRVEARVHPAFIRNSHPLASVSDSYNAVFLHGNAVGELMMYGRGAGDAPTASSVISDMITAARSTDACLPVGYGSLEKAEIESDWESDFYIRLTVADEPGVLAQITGVFGRFRISISTVHQKGFDVPEVPVVFVTHKASSKAMHAAVDEIKKLSSIVSVDNVIHVIR